MKLFETDVEAGMPKTFSLQGNGQYGYVTRTGWRESSLSSPARDRVLHWLKHEHTDKVYERAGKYYAFLLNGVEKHIYG